MFTMLSGILFATQPGVARNPTGLNNAPPPPFARQDCRTVPKRRAHQKAPRWSSPTGAGVRPLRDILEGEDYGWRPGEDVSVGGKAVPPEVSTRSSTEDLGRRGGGSVTASCP